jgi:hypothetical protein
MKCRSSKHHRDENPSSKASWGQNVATVKLHSRQNVGERSSGSKCRMVVMWLDVHIIRAHNAYIYI